MNITTHFIVSMIASAFLYPVYGWNVLLIFVGGMLIDIDHYFWYVYRYEKFDLSGCYMFYDNKNIKQHIGILLIFHTIEFMFVGILLVFYNKFGLIFTIGLSLHYILDILERIFIMKRFATSPSIIYWIIKNKIQKL